MQFYIAGGPIIVYFPRPLLMYGLISFFDVTIAMIIIISLFFVDYISRLNVIYLYHH